MMAVAVFVSLSVTVCECVLQQAQYAYWHHLSYRRDEPEHRNMQCISVRSAVKCARAVPIYTFCVHATSVLLVHIIKSSSYGFYCIGPAMANRIHSVDMQYAYIYLLAQRR